MRSNIEKIKIAATDLVTSATSVATLSSGEQSVTPVQVDGPVAGDRIRPWLTHATDSLGGEAASLYTSTESTRIDSIFSEPEGPLTSPTSEAESIVPLPLKARGRVGTSRESRNSVASDNSSIRRRDHEDGDLSIVLSMMRKWEKSAQVKLTRGDLAGAHQDLRTALDCRDRISSSDFANNRELVVLQKLIEIGGQYLELSQFGESEHLVKFAVDRGSQLSTDTSDSLRGDIVARAGALALAKLELCNLQEFEKLSGITKLHRSKVADDKTRKKASDEFALQVASRACEVARQRLDEDSHDLEACDKLCRTALQYGSSIHHADTNISEVANEVIEENIDRRRFREAESLAEQVIEHGRRLPPDVIYQADLGRTLFNLAYSCYSQRTEEKLTKAELVLSTSEEWQGNDAHLVHATSFLLAQTYWKKGNLDGAENCCWTALKGRMDLYGDEHENYLEVVDLFVRILLEQGQTQEASLHAIQLTPEYRKNAAAEWCSLHASYESQDDVLKRAIKGGYQEAVNILVTEGIHFEVLFRHAASVGDLETARMLLAAGGLSLSGFSHSSRTPAPDHPIALADQGGRTEMLKLLLANALSIEDCAATYDLNWAVREQRVAATTALLNLGARPDEKTNGTTVLHLAVRNDWLSTLQALLGAKPSLEVTDTNGATPLHVAVLRGHRSIVEALLDAGADIESKKGSFTALHLAISEHMNTLIQPLLDRGASPVAESDNGINALHLAVMANNRSTVADLLTRCPTLINSQNGDGRNALHIALTSADDDMARLLIDQGIDVNAKTSSGQTAYDLSRQSKSKHRTLEKLLLSKMNLKPSRFLRFSSSGPSKPETNTPSTTTSSPTGVGSAIAPPTSLPNDIVVPRNFHPPKRSRTIPSDNFMFIFKETTPVSRSST